MTDLEIRQAIDALGARASTANIVRKLKTKAHLARRVLNDLKARGLVTQEAKIYGVPDRVPLSARLIPRRFLIWRNL